MMGEHIALKTDEAIALSKSKERIRGGKVMIDRELVNEVAMDIYDGNYNLFFDEIERNGAMGFTVFRSVGDAFYDGEVLILDNETNEFISWYKLAHIGRDLHTNIATEEQLRNFIQKFYDCNKEES